VHGDVGHSQPRSQQASPPNIKHPHIQIANNRSGDLDLNVVHQEHKKFLSKDVQIIWEAINKRGMHAALP